MQDDLPNNIRSRRSLPTGELPMEKPSKRASRTFPPTFVHCFETCSMKLVIRDSGQVAPVL